MALMLSRLGIEPMELQLKLIAAYTDGEIVTADTLEVDLEAIFKEVILGHQYAINLSINRGIPTAETMPMIIAKANIEAKSLVLNIGYFVPDMVHEFLSKANSESFALALKVSEKDPNAIPSEILGQAQAAATIAATPAPKDAGDKPAEPEDEEEQEEEVAGLGSLFG